MEADKLTNLIDRLRKCRGFSNKLDIEIDLALFVPDSRYLSVDPNAAGTKLVYRLADGSKETHWAHDHTLTSESIETAIHRLAGRAALANGDEGNE